jgi:hypothetical protein
MQLSLDNIFIVKKGNIAFGLVFLGLLIAYLGSMNVWFLWPVISYYGIIASCLLGLGWLISMQNQCGIFENSRRQLLTLIYFVFQCYEIIVNGKNFNAFIVACFDTAAIFFLMSLTKESLKQLGKDMSIFIGGVLLFSIPAYILYLLDFPLPNVTIQDKDGIYLLSNYYFFVIDAITAAIFPRFRSIFLEPGHIGTVCALLLFTQLGKWHKWYNVLMIIALLMSFSLAAYVLFVIIIFAGMWMKRKKVVLKLLAVAAVMTGIGIGAYFYNDGNNLLYQLILVRMEPDSDGRLSGDNRVTDSFEDEYNSFLESDDLLWGKDFTVEKFGSGNSGYRVFIYNYGLVGVLIATLFYLAFIIDVRDRRAFLAMWAIVLALFWERATPMQYHNIIPLLVVAHWSPKNLAVEEKENGDDTSQKDIC